MLVDSVDALHHASEEQKVPALFTISENGECSTWDLRDGRCLESRILLAGSTTSGTSSQPISVSSPVTSVPMQTSKVAPAGMAQAQLDFNGVYGTPAHSLHVTAIVVGGEMGSPLFVTVSFCRIVPYSLFPIVPPRFVVSSPLALSYRAHSLSRYLPHSPSRIVPPSLSRYHPPSLSHIIPLYRFLWLSRKWIHIMF